MAAVPVPYVHATTAADAQRWLGDLGSPRFVAVDTETGGWDPLLDRLRLVQVSAGPDRPVLVVDAERLDPAVLGGLLADEGVLKVFHHGAFDLRFLAQAGLVARRVADTMLAQQLLDGGARTAHGSGLAQLASFRLGRELDKSIRETFAAAAPLNDAHLQYAADDAAATWEVFDQQWRELVGHRLVEVARLEFAALPALAALQLRGVAFDAERWEALVRVLEARLPALEDAVQAAFVTHDSPRTLFGPEPVNLDSPEQVQAALARVGVQVESTRSAVLRDHLDVPAVHALLAYREVAKVTSGFGGDWAQRVVHPATGRIHADWRQIVGAGRIACSDPNLTQIPKEAAYRACFRAGPGRALVVADYSQQELRILAAVSGDEALTDVFRQGRDLHASTAAMVFGVHEDAVAPGQRKAAKALNFGLMYGMGAPGFARATGTGLDEARDTMKRYFAAFPRVEAWLAAAESSARRSGRTRTPLGRVRLLDPAEPLTTLARNAPIQGAGADMTKLALAAVAARLTDGAPMPADGPVLVVHDELVVEVPAERAAWAAREVEAGMLEAARRVLGPVPAAVDVMVTSTWGADGGEAAEGSSRLAVTAAAGAGAATR